MNKRHILLTLACIATITSQGQISYQKYYDKAQKQTAVEGTLSDDSVRIGDWTNPKIKKYNNITQERPET